MTLHHEARQRWGYHCPCCNARMTKKPAKRHMPMPPSLETTGHDVALARGGDPRVWLHICWRCNNDQGDLSFEVWARKLGLELDPRTLRVAALALFIHQWRLRSSLRPPRVTAGLLRENAR